MISHVWILNYENVDYFCAVVFITYKHFLLSFDCFFKCVGVSKCSLAVGHFQTYPPSLESKLKRFVYLLSFFPSWSLLVVLFLSALRPPQLLRWVWGSLAADTTSGPQRSVAIWEFPWAFISYQHPAEQDANMDVKRGGGGEPSALRIIFIFTML